VEEMNQVEQQAMKVLGGVASNKQAASNLGHQTLTEELTAGTAKGLGSQMTE